MPGELVVGVDLGTTALKAGLFDLDGTLLGLAEAEYTISRPQPDRAEQDPCDWLSALSDVLGELAPGAHGRAPAAIGICSQVNTHVFVDAFGVALRPAIVWQDQRCGQLASALNELLASTGAVNATGFKFAASSIGSRAEWVRREEPDVWAATRHIVSPKDFMTMHLCRRAAVTDRMSCFDIVDDNGEYDREVVALVEGLGERLPPFRQFDAPLGVVKRRDLPLVQGATVVTGTMDAWGNLYGSAVTEHGQGMEVAGTSEILGVLSRDRYPTFGVVSFPSIDGLHLHAGPTQAGGAALKWFAGIHGRSIQEVLAAAAEAGAGAGGVVFLPHLLGERAPLWDSDVRGAFIGLGSDHSFVDLSRAVLEGVAYSARHLLEEIEKAAGLETVELRASGGCSQSDLWCQIKADVMRRTISRVRVRHSGCLGAALMASSGAQLTDGLSEAAIKAVHIDRKFEPLAHSSTYDDLYAAYRDVYHALKPTHHALARARRRAAAPAAASRQEA